MILLQGAYLVIGATAVLGTIVPSIYNDARDWVGRAAFLGVALVCVAAGGWLGA